MRTASPAFFSFLSLFPLALLSAAACGGSAFDSRDGLGAGTAGAAAGGAANGGSGGLDLSACTSNTQCEVVPISCCSCGTGPSSNFTAINAAYEMQFSARCAAVACAPCEQATPPLDDPRHYLVATCQRPAEASANAAGRCVVVDLRATELTACQTASDCSLRSGTSCCSGCSGSIVALNGSHMPELSGLICGSEPVACPACAPSFDQYLATCSEGRCGVEFNPCPASHPCP